MDMQATLDSAPGPILSGEGSGPGTCEIYEGPRTTGAVLNRLKKERQGRDRWARALLYTHTNDMGAVDLRTGELRSWPGELSAPASR